MAFINCNNGSPGGTMNETVLWTNPSPSSAFAIQDITLDDSILNYKYIKFTILFSTSINNEMSVLYDANEFANTRTANNAFASSLVFSRINNASYARQCSYVSNTSIYFSDSYSFAGTTKNNNNCIPYKVIGCS